MKIAVMGTGEVGRTIASKLVELGHHVRLGSRTADNAKGVAWVEEAGERASTGTYVDAAAFGELVVNATLGVASVEALKSAGEDTLAGKIIVDVSNPLDFSGGFPPKLSVSNDDSLGEQIQRNFPRSKVVKTLNTMWNGLMVDPRKIESSHVVFLCGNDDGAKGQVRSLLESFGWRADEMLDLGDITNARGTEAYVLLWTRIYAATDNGAFNLQIANV